MGRVSIQGGVAEARHGIVETARSGLGWQHAHSNARDVVVTQLHTRKLSITSLASGLSNLEYIYLTELAFTTCLTNMVPTYHENSCAEPCAMLMLVLYHGAHHLTNVTFTNLTILFVMLARVHET